MRALHISANVRQQGEAISAPKRTYHPLIGGPQESWASQLDREDKRQEAIPTEDPMSTDGCTF